MFQNLIKNRFEKFCSCKTINFTPIQSDRNALTTAGKLHPVSINSIAEKLRRYRLNYFFFRSFWGDLFYIGFNLPRSYLKINLLLTQLLLMNVWNNPHES